MTPLDIAMQAVDFHAYMLGKYKTGDSVAKSREAVSAAILAHAQAHTQALKRLDLALPVVEMKQRQEKAE